MKNNQDVKPTIDNNTWIMFAMMMFTVAKVAALICATIVAVKVNLWVGSALFIAAILFRITWTYIPNKPLEPNGAVGLIDHAKGLVEYRQQSGPLNFQLEKADTFIFRMRVVLEEMGELKAPSKPEK